MEGGTEGAGEVRYISPAGPLRSVHSCLPLRQTAGKTDPGDHQSEYITRSFEIVCFAF